MTEETAQIFNAPWKAVNHMHVVSRSDDSIGVTCDEHNARRISHLPELYDALMETVYYKCFECMGGLRHNIDMTREELVKNGCPKQNKSNVCIYVKHIELLRNVRDGK